MSYHGYDPFNDIGSEDLTTLNAHTVLLCAFDLAAPKFVLYLSNVFEAGLTAFSALKLYGGADPNIARLIATLNVSDATVSNVGNVTLNSVVYPGVNTYQWVMDDDPFEDVDQFSVAFDQFTSERSGEDFTGIIHWPFLDLGAPGIDKSMVGFDLVSDAPEGVLVSIGYNQRNISARTPDYEVDADTLTGQTVPFPVTAPTFDLKLTFNPQQQWEWQQAILYVNT